MYLVSSQDLGQSWTLEKTIEIERDMREPYFLEVNGTLFFYYFEAGTNPIKFEPGYLQRIEYLGAPGGEDCVQVKQVGKIACCVSALEMESCSHCEHGSKHSTTILDVYDHSAK